MSIIYRLAISCFLGTDGEIDFAELERYMRRMCGEVWVATPDWRFEAPPHSDQPSVPVIVPAAQRDVLVSPEFGAHQVISEAIIGEAEERHWRHICFQRSPFPQPDGGHLPWDTIRFRLHDDGKAFRAVVLAGLVSGAWDIEGDTLLVTPADAKMILQSQSAEIFQYMGRVRIGLIGLPEPGGRPVIAFSR